MYGTPSAMITEVMKLTPAHYPEHPETEAIQIYFLLSQFGRPGNRIWDLLV